MIGSTAKTLLKNRLGRGTSANTAFDTWMQSELEAAQTRLEKMSVLPYFLVSERAFSVVTINEERVQLPTGFLREVEETVVQLYDTSSGEYEELVKNLPEDLKIHHPDEETGRPKRYAIRGDYFLVCPIPDKTTYQIWMTYYKAADVITDEAENAWLQYYPDLLIAEAGVLMASTLRNDAALNSLSTLKNQQMEALLRDENARLQANLDPTPED